MKKFISIATIILLAITFIKFNSIKLFAQSSDAIAIRIISNPNNVGAFQWYQDQGFKGSPQSMVVDGYEAVRDGNTVYVNSANIIDNDNNQELNSGDNMNTNIFVMTYNQQAEKSTSDIFGQIINNIKFNSNIKSSGRCNDLSEDTKNNISNECSGTIGCWNFENNYTDESGNGFNGTVTGPMDKTGFSSAVSGQSVNFPNTNNSTAILIGSSNLFKMTNEFTVTASIYPTGPGSSASSGGIIVNKESEYELARASDGLIIYAINTPGLRGAAGWVFYSTDYYAPLNTWTDLIWSYGNNHVKLYANGALVHDRIFTGTNNIIAAGAPTSLRIGGRQALSQFFQGKIDKVRIYNKVFNQDCVSDLECSGIGYCESEKSSIVRDVKRLADLKTLNNLLVDYKKSYGFCPRIEAGSYIKNRSLSVWSSWSILGAAFGSNLPIDPINQLGICTRLNNLDAVKYNARTCWNDKDKLFATSTPVNQLNMNLPEGSFVYNYGVSADGLSCGFYATTENLLNCNNIGVCTASNITAASMGSGGGSSPTSSAAPEISCSLSGNASKQEYSGSVSATPKDGKSISSLVISANSGNFSSWSGVPSLAYQSTNSGGTKFYFAKATKSGDAYSGINLINYSLTLKATDNYGIVTTKNCPFNLGGFCGDGIRISSSNEECDLTDNVATTPQQSSIGKQYGCSTICKVKDGYCGNGTIQGSFGEQCDPFNYATPTPVNSNATNMYACGAAASGLACKWLDKNNAGGYCGDGARQSLYTEECDLTDNVATTPQQSSIGKQYGCSTICKVKDGYCGNGTVEGAFSEQCDPFNYATPTPVNSNATNMYACGAGGATKACKWLDKNNAGGYCGDGSVQAPFGEECDDNNRVNTDACTNSCLWTKKTLPSVSVSASTDGQITADSVIYNDQNNTTSLNIVAGGQYLKLGGTQPTVYAYLAAPGSNEILKIKVTENNFKRDCDNGSCFWTTTTDGGLFTSQSFNVGGNCLAPSRTAVNLETGDVWINCRGHNPQRVARYDDDMTLLQGPCDIGTVNTNPLAGGGGGGVAIDGNGDVWAGDMGTGEVVKFITGSGCTRNKVISTNRKIYGLGINSYGEVFFRSADDYLGKISNPDGAHTIKLYPAAGSYGLTFDDNGNPWSGYTSGGIQKVSRTAADGTVTTKYSAPSATTWAVSVDSAGGLWGASAGVGGIHKFNSSGTFLFSLDSGNLHHGISGTSDGYIISPRYNTSDASWLDIYKGLAAGNVFQSNKFSSSFYTYADMAGLNRGKQFRSGNWTKIIDSGFADQHWGNVSSTQITGAGTSIAIFVGSNNNSTQLNASLVDLATWNSYDYKNTLRSGRYLMIRAQLKSSVKGQSPVLSNIIIN